MTPWLAGIDWSSFTIGSLVGGTIQFLLMLAWFRFHRKDARPQYITVGPKPRMNLRKVK